MHEVKLTRRGTRPGVGWVPTTRGAHRPADADEPRLADLHAWQAVLPDEARFTHLTGAEVHDLWLPPLPDDLPVWIVLPYGVPRPQRVGLRVIRSRDLAPPAYVEGLRVDPTPDCLARAARDLRHVDLTCLTDSALHLGKAERAELDEWAARTFPGVPRLRDALAAADESAESIWETLLRLLHKACGIDVEPQRELYDEHGAFVARGDLWLVGTRRFHEYDGADHRRSTQHRKDLKRDGRIGDTDWERRGYTSQDVLLQGIAILRAADRALGREHDPSRIRAWHALLRDSLFSPAGTDRLRRRLGLGTYGSVGKEVS